MAKPIKSTTGGTDIGPRDPTRNAENPDVLVPPSTDKRSIPKLRLRFHSPDGHRSLQDGDGYWVDKMPLASIFFAKETIDNLPCGVADHAARAAIALGHRRHERTGFLERNVWGQRRYLRISLHL
jgi:hypothetical protein